MGKQAEYVQSFMRYVDAMADTDSETDWREYRAALVFVLREAPRSLRECGLARYVKLVDGDSKDERFDYPYYREFNAEDYA